MSDKWVAFPARPRVSAALLVGLLPCWLKPWQVPQVIDGQRSVLAFERPRGKRPFPESFRMRF
jgi:hypothetical protein